MVTKIALLRPMALLMLPLLLQCFAVTEGGLCPVRKAFVPESTTGYPWSSILLSNSSKAAISELLGKDNPVWVSPSGFQMDCCGSGRIVEWIITPTSEFGYIARVNATCTDGTQISTPLYGYNGTEPCSNNTESSKSVIQPDDKGIFSYVSTVFTTSFMGVGQQLGYASRVATCPTGTRAIGIGARSGCYAIVELQVICARPIETGQGTLYSDSGTSLDRVDQCLSYASAASNKTAAISNSSQSGVLQTDCCPWGEGIANWTLVQTNHYIESYNGLGLIQGRCTDGTLLAPSLYGYNGTYNPLCNKQRLLDAYHYNTPKSQRFHYSVRSLDESDGQLNLLTSFMSPPSATFGFGYTGSSVSGYKSSMSCPSGQGAVGYSAASSCYSLTDVAVLCGNLSDSAWAVLNEYGSTEEDPPADSNAGVCLGGISLVPNDTDVETIGPTRIAPIRTSKLNPGITLYSGQASTTSSSCCPSGQVITGFNVWPSDNILLLVGKVSAVCSPYSPYLDHLDGAQSTNSSEIAYGFNGTDSSNTTIFCPNATIGDMKSIPLMNGSWTYRSGWIFESLMEWPFRTDSNAYGYISNMSTASCSSGQQPIAFSARRSCWALADFRVICGKVNLTSATANVDVDNDFNVINASIASTSNTEHGLSAAGKAGIAVGVVGAVAILAAAGSIFYRRQQEHERNTPPDLKNHHSHLSSRSSDLHFVHGPEVPEVPEESFPGNAGVTTGTTGNHFHSVYPKQSRQDFEDMPKRPSSMSGVSSDVSAVLFTKVIRSSEVVHMEDIDLPPQEGPSTASFKSLPLKWKIPLAHVKLLCRGHKPIMLGKGGYGMVYRAIVRRDEAAIKIVTGGGEDEQARLLHEIKILEQCKSVNIVQFLGYSISKDGLLLCMEYMSGGTLFSALRRSDEFQWYNRGWQAMRAVAAGLFCLHEQNVAHLDLKTPNILIGSDKKVKIADMGLGKLVKGRETQASQLGTIAWMAPEVLLRGTCALQSDVWSFSTILWEVCTLRKPAYALKVDDIPIPDEAPQELVALIHECRAENYWERPSMEVVCDRLDKIPNSR